MISILIPIYNGIEFIEESVNSVLKQSYEKWEIIIGVNGHEENSEVYKIAKKYEGDKIKVLDLFMIKGKSNALNKMLSFTSYDYIALLDVDDIWLPSKLETQLSYLHYDVIGTKCVYFGDLSGIIPNIPTGDISHFDFVSVNPIINSSSIIRKEYCYWYSLYDGVEDYDLWLRLRKQNKRFYNCDDVLVLHRIHTNSAFNTKNHDTLIQEIKENYSKKEDMNSTTNDNTTVVLADATKDNHKNNPKNKNNNKKKKPKKKKHKK